MATITGSPLPADTAPARFEARRSVKIVDGVMSGIIKTGGIGVIVAVFAIFAFILWQTIPLFLGASVQLLDSYPTPQGRYAALAVDEWSELPMLVESDGTLRFVRYGNADAPVETVSLGDQLGSAVTALRVRPGPRVITALENGTVSINDVRYGAFFDGDRREIRQTVDVGTPVDVTDEGRIIDVDLGDSGTDKVLVALVETDAGRRVTVVRLEQAQTLMGPGEIRVAGSQEMTPLIEGVPERILASSRGDAFLVLVDGGAIEYFDRGEDGFERRQRFTPFEDLSDPTISTADFVFGDVSLVLVSGTGVNRIFSLFREREDGQRLWGETKVFPDLPGAGDVFARSVRNKAFLVGAGTDVSLRYSTTESVRWQADLPFDPELATISGKNDTILFFDEDESRLHVYSLHDPHAEAGLQAFFGTVWYEGASAPKFAWQSTGGSDDYEPKLSMIPLLVGTLKGTFYAMIFAVPVALTAAIYTSQFAHWRVRALIKPIMEVMASLPSVVLGFLGALWLAPILETKVPTVLVLFILVPAAAMFMGWAWPKTPLRIRNRLGLYGELALLMLTLGVALGASVLLGPVVERTFFTVTDPATGERIADFRDWWREWTGLDYQQRNSMIVGFMMGFAVIPIVFTISEDALSNVPQTLRSGSLALGATRWQTAIRVVVPTASAGIFSALMVGLGRAVGETMIVLMATGNTPIMEMNIFSGMRTLSANIATELPEAPHHGTLFRALFLGALLLFMMTFVVNTIAEVLRQHLRTKYKTV